MREENLGTQAGVHNDLIEGVHLIWGPLNAGFTVAHAYKKDGAAHRKFWKEPLRVTKILFCWRGLKFFSLLGGTNSHITHYLLSYFFRLNTLKDTTKVPAVDRLRLNTLRGTTSTPVFFTWQSPPPLVKHSPVGSCSAPFLVSQTTTRVSIKQLNYDHELEISIAW